MSSMLFIVMLLLHFWVRGQGSAIDVNRYTRKTERSDRHRPSIKADQGEYSNVSAFLGRTATLRCTVLNKGNRTLSWIRHRDLHLLTVDHYTYTTDQRFQALYEASSGDWLLMVRSVQPRDKGVYECQVGTTPPISHFVVLNITEPVTRILGGKEVHIKRGSTLNLTCHVMYHAKPPDVVWLHEGKRIHYKSGRGGVSIVTLTAEETSSSVLIHKAVPADSGSYVCQPVGGKPSNVTVHVIDGELRAAMHGRAGKFEPGTMLLTPLLLLLLLSFYSSLGLLYSRVPGRRIALPEP